jgi:hypothetical protein
MNIRCSRNNRAQSFALFSSGFPETFDLIHGYLYPSKWGLLISIAVDGWNAEVTKHPFRCIECCPNQIMEEISVPDEMIRGNTP